jgi:mono/diheme cytochrome c family protein
MKKFIIIVLSAIVAAVSLAYAQNVVTTATQKQITLPPERVDLKPGQGMDKTATSCIICHSADYITMQPKGTKAQWTAEVNKMIKVMGAPISADDAKTISDYLAANYGTGQ